MKKLSLSLMTILISLSWVVSGGWAQYKEVGVQEFTTPVDAPDFLLQKLGGGTISSMELRGKVVLLNFFTTW